MNRNRLICWIMCLLYVPLSAAISYFTDSADEAMLFSLLYLLSTAALMVSFGKYYKLFWLSILAFVALGYWYFNSPSQISILLSNTKGVVSWDMYYYDGGYVGTVQLKNNGKIKFSSMTEGWFDGEADYITLMGFGDYSVRSIVCTTAKSETPQLLGAQRMGLPFGKKGDEQVLGRKLTTFQEIVDSYDDIVTVLEEWPKSPTEKPHIDMPSYYPKEFNRHFVWPTGTRFDGTMLDDNVCL